MSGDNPTTGYTPATDLLLELRMMAETAHERLDHLSEPGWKPAEERAADEIERLRDVLAWLLPRAAAPTAIAKIKEALQDG